MKCEGFERAVLSQPLSPLVLRQSLSLFAALTPRLLTGCSRNVGIPNLQAAEDVRRD
jgi:hypothetical protein